MTAPNPNRIRVLIVDDSPFARKVVRDVLSATDDIEVVDFARDGIEALERIENLAPDIVTLDLNMPELDGLGVLAALDARPKPRVIVVSTEGDDTEMGLNALKLGAVDIVRKPTGIANVKLFDLADELLETVRAVAHARPSSTPREPPSTVLVPTVNVRPGAVVVIGASTGGPQAVQRLLEQLDASFPVPIVVALHLPIGYTQGYAARLDRTLPFTVVESEHGLRLESGMVVVARAGIHTFVERDGESLVCALRARPLDTPHRPSVDVLLASAAGASGPRAIGVVLTGMGSDGTAGARSLREAGAAVLTESEASCVVYGMPRAVIEAGLSSVALALDELAAEISARCLNL